MRAARSRCWVEVSMPGAECCRRRLGLSRQSRDWLADSARVRPFARLSSSVCVQPRMTQWPALSRQSPAEPVERTRAPGGVPIHAPGTARGPRICSTSRACRASGARPRPSASRTPGSCRNPRDLRRHRPALPRRVLPDPVGPDRAARATPDRPRGPDCPLIYPRPSPSERHTAFGTYQKSGDQRVAPGCQWEAVAIRRSRPPPLVVRQ